MSLVEYFARIEFDDVARADLKTLQTLHRLHANAIPFENLDVQLGRKCTTSAAAAFEKLVRQRRGGWCYEQNGVFEAALTQIGFAARRVSAGVMRQTGGEAQKGNHLCLLVDVDGVTWLVDVGFGGSLAAPLPLYEAARHEAPYTIGLRKQEDGYWRFWETEGGREFSFDFREEAADEALLAAKCEELQTLPNSPFVQNLVVQQRQGDTHLSLRGRVLSQTGTANRHTLQTADEFIEVLRTRFGLDLPEAEELWPAICSRHTALGLAN